MNALFMLVGISLMVAGFFLLAFIWAMNKGQFEDACTPSIRILFEEQPREKNDTIQK